MALLFVLFGFATEKRRQRVGGFRFGFLGSFNSPACNIHVAFHFTPFIILVLVRSKGHYPKALIAAILGGGIAFLIYYLRPIWLTLAIWFTSFSSS